MYVEALTRKALRHRAVTHPYLTALANDELPDLRWALRDFAAHYLHYSQWFPRYLTTVISRLERDAHRKALLENLTEESGKYGDEEIKTLARIGIKPDWIVGIAHPRLFQRFCHAVQAPTDRLPSDATACWREMFLSLLVHSTPAEAVGALGLGTETIVSTIYKPFVAAIARLPDLAPHDTVFFPLHTTVDDNHQATLQAIASDLATDESAQVGLRRGMLKALALRTAFWDWLYERALDPDIADRPSMGKMSVARPVGASR